MNKNTSRKHLLTTWALAILVCVPACDDGSDPAPGASTPSLTASELALGDHAAILSDATPTILDNEDLGYIADLRDQLGLDADLDFIRDLYENPVAFGGKVGAQNELLGLILTDEEIVALRAHQQRCDDEDDELATSCIDELRGSREAPADLYDEPDLKNPDPEPLAGIPDASISDSGSKTIWPGCLGGSGSFTDTIQYNDGGLFLGGDELVWWSQSSVGPQWNCPQLPSWVWHHATIEHHLKWTSLQGTLKSIDVKSSGSGVTFNVSNGLLTAKWTNYVTNTDWVFGPKKTWKSAIKIRAIYGSAIKMRAEHRATVTFYGPKGEKMSFELEAHKEQWG